MNPQCDSIRERLAAECSQERPWSVSLEEHLQGCAECAAFVERLRVQWGLLRDLPRMAAPEALLGSVVSACQPGFQQARAVACLGGLALQAPPAELDQRVNGLFEELRREQLFADQEAPAALGERVGSDLADLPQAISRVTLEKLPRLETPPQLRERVAKDLPTFQPEVRTGGGWKLLLGGMAAAAGLLLLANTDGLSPAGLDSATPGGEAKQVAALSFQVVRPASIEGLSPGARALAAQVSGGLTSISTASQRVPVELDSPGHSINSGAGPGASSSLVGWGAGAPSGAGGAGQASAGVITQGPAYFAGLAQAPFVLHYRGIREVTLRPQAADGSPELVYREEVASDGAGNYTVVPLNIISPPMDVVDEEQFRMYQASREGFFFRHRDFRIRDTAVFWENYHVQDLGLTQIIAGRTCDTFLISRIDGTGNLFRVAIDPSTSLVMLEERAQQNGWVVSRVEYETFGLLADLSDLQLTGARDPWTPSDVARLANDVMGDPLIPVAPPKGFELRDVGYRSNVGLGADETWVQLTYGDGVEETFFLFRDLSPTSGNGGHQGPVSGMDDVVRAVSVGPWAILDGRVGGREVLAVGRVDEGDLLLMLQSAFD